MAIEQISPQEAYRRQQAEPATALVDVRTVAEFQAGHPQGALNIPVFVIDAASGQMMPNPDFATVFQAAVGKDQPVVMTCKSGGRSQAAAEVAASLGYPALANLQGGFGGNPMAGQLGWVASDLPVSTGDGDGRSYDALKAKAH